MLRLGSKYQISHIRNEAIRRLNICFPSTMAEYDRLYTNGAHPGFFPAIYNERQSIIILNLARSFQLQNLIPVALYNCCQLSCESLFRGVENESGGLECLSPEDLRLCLIVREKMQERMSVAARMMVSPRPCQSCRTRNVCRQALLDMVDPFQSSLIGNTANPLRVMTRWLRAYGGWRKLCQGCLKQLTAKWHNEREVAWKVLMKIVVEQV